MSTSLVLKGLEIVESTYRTGESNNKKRKGIKAPHNQNFINKSKIRDIKGVNSHKNKITITEARKNFKTKNQILKENLKKLKLLKEASKITLDKETVNQIIERAVTKRPVKKVKKQKKQDKKTAFSEEDFKKFEAEYFDD